MTWKFFLIAFLILILEIIAVAIIFEPHDVERSIKQEISYLQTWFGKDKTKEMVVDAHNAFDSVFVSTGIMDEFNSWFDYRQDVSHIKNEGVRALGESGFVYSFWEKLDQFWMIMKFSLLRVQMMSVSLLLALTFIIPSVVDGLMIRQVNRYGDGNVSVNLYNFAEYSFYACLALPVYLMFAPVALSPIVMVFYTLFLSFSIFILAQNLQHRV
jgi:hypothetical protein